MKLIVLTMAILFAFNCAAQTRVGCNPEMPRYSEWSASQHFPDVLTPAKQNEVVAKLSQLSLGLTKERVKAIAGPPDYVGEGSFEPNAIACIWIYSFEDKSPSTEPKDKHLVLLGFDSLGELAAILPNHVEAVRVQQVTDKSCEPDNSNSTGTIAKVIGEGRAYTASSERQGKIHAGYPSLSVGMSADKLEGLLGKPDFVVVMPHGHAAGSWFVGEPCKRQMVYVLRQSSNNPIDPDTVAIYLSLDEHGRLFWASPQNVQGLKEIGSAVR